MIIWILSIAITFFIMCILFQLDERYTYGHIRGLVEDWWVFFFLILIVPTINVVVCVIGIAIFIFIFIVEKLDDNNLTGEEIIKKIFFIKDEQ
ncbi:hypothetical protein SUNDANCE_93 [Brevibacillus phage Sundance]|uniref:hypothetical protein n=1 Tax=Brevibacillus phage Sundance TaxID=1691958 RepID=UPI0006BC85F3|nr:hypothetical protein AVT09_gp093 [Brevibacillus phage Sundance]ALA47909.1 hypothetical protein SUNDANCE_93 [Brevibacillus phage Sundance]